MIDENKDKLKRIFNAEDSYQIESTEQADETKNKMFHKSMARLRVQQAKKGY